MKRTTRTWLKAAGIRAVKTFAQSAVAMLPAAATITAVNWEVVIGTAALAAVASVLTSLAGLPEVGTEKNSLRLEEDNAEQSQCPWY